jgi:hypothetical protein
MGSYHPPRPSLMLLPCFTRQYLLDYLAEWLEAHCTRDVSLLFHSKTVSANWAVPEFSKVRARPTNHHQVNVDSSVRRSAACLMTQRALACR